VTSLGQVVAAEWERAVRSMPMVLTTDEWWASVLRSRIHDLGASTRPVFGLLTPINRTDASLLERE
jgi:hypothetical protein